MKTHSPKFGYTVMGLLSLLRVKRGDTAKSKLLHHINIELHPRNTYLKHKDPFTKKE
ncbi:hypothetical protein Q4603_00045 [Zobellia galactanivorans]|uniref:hypothetical protein n=1 Tax=Zobellia TaxID=112040 RepID=UPI0013747971|nr:MULTISPECIES: hypothetical protein [Zobellia]MDO6806971.1 hypothetical protein [Zobellia galactanivorans]